MRQEKRVGHGEKDVLGTVQGIEIADSNLERPQSR
jgi:hypothetical protein